MADPFQILGITGGISKTGITSVSVPFYVLTFSEALTVAPTVTGLNLPIVDRKFRQVEDGRYEVTLTYEGSDHDDSTPDQTDFELDISMADDPIESHKDFPNFGSQFLWDEEKGAFPKLDADGDPNDFYGVESYLAIGAIFRITYSSRNVHGSLLRGIGSIVSTPPGIGQFNLPPAADTRNWLKLAPKIKRRGNTTQVTEEWMLSGPKGWNTKIYNVGQLGN